MKLKDQSNRLKKILHRMPIEEGEYIKMMKPIPLIIALIFIFLFSCSNQEDLDEQMVGMARKGDIEKVKELIGKGANIDASDKKYNATALMWAAHEGHIEILNYLIANRATIDASKPSGQTSLWFAAQKGQLEAAEILIKNGANVNAVTKEGVTALMIATQNNHQDIVALLSKKGKTE